MVAEQKNEEMSLAYQEDLVTYIIYELLPLFAETCGDGAAARWRRRMLIAEVDRQCDEHGPL